MSTGVADDHAHLREIVQHYKGKLWVVSTPGLGSTFAFTLPLPRSKLAFLAA